MGIRSGSITFTRFFVPDPPTEEFWNFIDERLKEGSFKDLSGDNEVSRGFCSWDDIFDSTFAYASYHKGQYVAFNFRQDERRVPPLILKQYVRRALEKFRSENDGRHPSHEEYEELKDEVHSRLLGRVLPRLSTCEVVWNPEGHWLIYGSTNSKMIDAFLEHFERIFRIYPVPLYHANWAVLMLPLDNRQKDLLSSLVPLKSPKTLSEGRFLGYEFLTWLWFQAELNDGTVQLKDGRKADFGLGERLVLSRPDEGKERIVCTTKANELHEARTALQQGKQVEELQLAVTIDSHDYYFTINTTLWAIKGLKVPKQLVDEDPDEYFLERMFFTEQVMEFLDTAYTKFLSQRLNPGWESDVLPAIKSWIQGSPPEIMV